MTETESWYADWVRRLRLGGALGHGVREDVLQRSVRSLDRELMPGGGSVRDFVVEARLRGVALLVAEELEGMTAGLAAELHAFLEQVLAAIIWLPRELTRKSPEPFVCMVCPGEEPAKLGSHRIGRPGYSSIHWSGFRARSEGAVVPGYSPHFQEIRRTVVHEVIGHQLAMKRGQ